jgi:hypothetical protein
MIYRGCREDRHLINSVGDTHSAGFGHPGPEFTSKVHPNQGPQDGSLMIRGANAIFQELEFDAMDHRKALKRLYTAFTICWLGVCSVGGVVVAASQGRGTITPTASGQTPATGEWTGYTKDLLKGIAGSEYEAIRKSYFFQDVAAAVWETGRRISSINLTKGAFVTDTGQKDTPESLDFIARFMRTTQKGILAWLAVTIIPPFLVYVLGFVAIPKMAGGFKSEESPNSQSH